MEELAFVHDGLERIACQSVRKVDVVVCELRRVFEVAMKGRGKPFI